MRFKIKDITSDGRVFTQALEPALLAEALDGTGADLSSTAGAVHFELTRSGDDVYVSGRITATVGIACSRCLRPTRVAVEQPVKMIYRRAEPGREDELAPGDDPLDVEDFGAHDGDFVDLRPMVREQLILSVPMSPRCREECRGLCPTCGQDLNERDCACDEKPRFSVLGAELQKLKR